MNQNNDPTHSTSCVKHGGGSVMVFVSGTGSQVFIDADRSNKIISEVYKAILIQTSATKLKG